MNKQKIILECYLALLILLIIRKISSFALPINQENMFYSFCIAFNSTYLLPYFFKIAQLGLSIVHLFPVIFVAFNKKIGPPEVWQTLFLLKIVFDIVGHTYEMNFFKSLTYFDSKILGIIFLGSIAPYIPQYIISYQYAFKTKS